MISLLITILVIETGCSRIGRQSSFQWQLILQVDRSTHDPEGAINQAVSIIEKRLDAAGIGAFNITREKPGSDRIIVKLPEVRDHDRVKNLITAGGRLELFHILSLPSPIPLVTYDTREKAVAFMNTLTEPSTLRVLPYVERAASGRPPNETSWLIVILPAIIDAADLKDAAAVAGRSASDDYQIDFSLNKTGAEKFGTWTGLHVNEYIAVTLNDEVKSAPFIKSQIFDRGEINGHYNKQAAEDLALTLRSGPLPAPLKILAEESIK